MTKAEAMELVATMQGAYPRMPFANATMEVYAMAMADLDYEAGKAAIMRLIQTSKWLPTIAEIRENVVEARVDLPPPELAWGEVMAAVSQVGMYQVPVFECEEIGRAVAAIGWRSICTEDNVASTRSRFIDAYRAVREQRIDDERTGRYTPPDRQLPGKPTGFLDTGTLVPVASRFGRRVASLPALEAGKPETEGDEP